MHRGMKRRSVSPYLVARNQCSCAIFFGAGKFAADIRIEIASAGDLTIRNADRLRLHAIETLECIVGLSRFRS